jgi:uncharacterized protein (TIGR00299 family) protein
MTVLYYDCFSGISGDMNLGAMVDIGVDPEYLKTELAKLNLEGYSINFQTDSRKGISGTRAIVTIHKETHGAGHDPFHEPGNHSHKREIREHGTITHEAHGNEAEEHEAEEHEAHEFEASEPDHRNLRDIKKIINKSRLNDFVKTTSLDIFQKVAEAEAKVHAKSINEIHFHEVGAIDSIVDIVGAAICYDYLKPDKIISSSVELGGGFTRCEHGIFPAPAPATAEILKNIPVKSGAVQSETTTPTGAAILATLADEFTDNIHFIIHKTGYGVGTKDFDIPNVLRVHLGDMNPEMYGHIMDLLFEKGADDVFITPIIMKKARPASKISVLCRPEIDGEIINILLTHTTSLGVRKHKVDKMVLKREFQEIMTKYGPVTLKTAIYKGKKLKSKPEYEDCIRIAKEKNIPVHLVYQEINKLIASLDSDAE